MEAFGVGDVLHDLGAEGFRGGEADLWAEVFEEGEFEGGVGLDVDGVEVEEVGLDGEGVFGKLSVKGGAVADVGDGVEGRRSPPTFRVVM